MRIVLLHASPAPGAGEDDQDVLAQAAAVREALFGLGHRVHTVAFSLDLGAVAASLTGLRPDVVFNLVEGAGGSGRHIALGPALLEDLGLAFTGAGSEAMALSSNKVFAKHVLAAAGIATPAARSMSGRVLHGKGPVQRWIVKSVWEHASTGLEQDCVLQGGDHGELLRAMARLAPRMGGQCLAEAYVHGREASVSLLDGPHGPTLLPPAEILFTDQPGHEPRVVGWRAKWSEESSESRNTPRRFGLEPDLAERLEDAALDCWQAFGLSGYARVDFRVDQASAVQVIDVNANPCLAPDAGFQASLAQAKIPFAQAVERILDAAGTARRHTP